VCRVLCCDYYGACKLTAKVQLTALNFLHVYRCRWSTGSNGDIWVLQIEPDDASSSTAKSSPKHDCSYSALVSDDVGGPDGQRTSRSPSVVSVPRADEMPLSLRALSSASSSSSSSSSSAANDRSNTADLVDLSVAHVIKCCRQPPWDQLLPVNTAGTRWQQASYADMLCSRAANNDCSDDRRSSSGFVHSPAELQRLLHITSV